MAKCSICGENVGILCTPFTMKRRHQECVKQQDEEALQQFGDEIAKVLELSVQWERQKMRWSQLLLDSGESAEASEWSQQWAAIFVKMSQLLPRVEHLLPPDVARSIVYEGRKQEQRYDWVEATLHLHEAIERVKYQPPHLLSKRRVGITGIIGLIAIVSDVLGIVDWLPLF